LAQLLIWIRNTFEKSVDILTEFGLLLVFSLWKKHFKDSDKQAFGHINQVCYNLIRAKQFDVAISILEFCLYKQKSNCPDNILKMMVINLANCFKNLKRDEECGKIISSVDWSASKDEYQLCISSLRGDIKRVTELIPIVANSGSVKAAAFREWPVFDWVRDNPEVIATFERVYEEPVALTRLESISGADFKAQPEAEAEKIAQSSSLGDAANGDRGT
jgi:hypothetical protein